jgi:tetratricopeptide (TPR) repeat protein
MLKDLLAKVGYRWTKPQSSDPWAYHALSKTHLEAQNWQEAIRTAQQAIALNPECPWFYDGLGKAYRGLGENQQAIVAFQKAIELDATIAWLHYELGCCWVKQGDGEKAVTALQQSIALNSDFAWAYHVLGEIWLDQDQPEAAIAAYQRALQLEPDQALFHHKLDYAKHVGAGLPMTASILFKHPPKLHRVFGQTGTLSVSEALLCWLDTHVNANWQTLETGAGISTLLFALKGTTHTCIVPDAELVDRIQAYCQRHQISTASLTFHIARSEAILPQLDLDLDLVLIDGRHAFPSPFIDWYYTTNFLKLNGITIVDDTQLWTGDLLRNFLQLEPEWELIEELPSSEPNSAIFRKLQAGSHDKWWLQQPYAMQQSPQSLKRIVT